MSPRFYEITITGLVAAYCLALPVWLIIIKSRLGLNREMIVSIFRMSLQLVAVGYVLKYLFEIHNWYITIAVFLVMVFFAARTVMARTGLKYPGVLIILGLAILSGTGLVVAVLVLFVIQVEPWYEPRYFIPLAGMVIGNSMNGCALAMERFYSGVKDKKSLIESLVAHGANGREASSSMFRSAFRASLIPTLSSMSGIGIVFIPGMMTGQILGGVEPLDSIRYQIVIMMAILGAVALASYLILLLEQRRFFDDYHLLRIDLFK